MAGFDHDSQRAEMPPTRSDQVTSDSFWPKNTGSSHFRPAARDKTSYQSKKNVLFTFPSTGSFFVGSEISLYGSASLYADVGQ